MQEPPRVFHERSLEIVVGKLPSSSCPVADFELGGTKSGRYICQHQPQGVSMRQRFHFIAALLALVSCDALAGLYRCADATGKLTFQETPCPSSSSSQKVGTASAAS